MDHLAANFGRLSTEAREWSPPGAQQPQSGTDSSGGVESDLNPTSVKEFVPGKGWSTTSGPAQKSPGKSGNAASAQQENPYQTSQHQQVQDEQEYVEVTLPAGPPASPFRSLHSFGMSDDMWRWHRDLSLEGLRQMDPADPRHKAIPPPYCNAFCLDDHHLHHMNNATPPRSSFGYPSSTFQVVSREDGFLYCLRRFDSVKSVSNKIAAAVLDQWTSLEHPGLATLHKCFVSQRAVFFVHQFVNGGASIRDRFLMGNQYMSENLLWSAICQLVTVLRRIHGAQLACRTLDSRHVLVQMNSLRLKLVVNCPGVVDALEFEARKSLVDLQMEDIRKLGYLILSMATGTDVSPSADASVVANCERFCLQNFSRDLHNLCMTLIRSQTPPSILDVSRALAGRIMDEYENTEVNLSRVERSLGAEYESGRMARLMMKLGCVNERPEFGPNRRWAESGDCYVLRLFRDYVFHQADGAGNPVMDLGHVITCLNKLDAADEEKIVLASRDGKSVVVVTYAEIARCLDSAYHELCSGAVQHTLLQGPGGY